MRQRPAFLSEKGIFSERPVSNSEAQGIGHFHSHRKDSHARTTLKHFSFILRGKDSTARDLMRCSSDQWGEVREYVLGEFTLIVPAASAKGDTCSTHQTLGTFTGWVKRTSAARDPSTNESEKEDLITVLSRPGSWPLSGDWTGSYSGVAYSLRDAEVVLFNDLLGYLPLYYHARGESVCGSTSLIVLGRALTLRPDPVGLLERITPPYCNYGRRTLLDGLQRLLPGEYVRFGLRGGVRHSFDNSLAGDVIQGSPRTLAPMVWERLRAETLFALSGSVSVNVALSGGWDSRLMLRAASDLAVPMRCLTYGGSDLYESGLARRCAHMTAAAHCCFPLDSRYFPPAHEMRTLARETESAVLLQWWPILSQSSDSTASILLGDLSESIDGRNIVAHSSREARVRSVLRQLSGQKDRFVRTSGPSFLSWRDSRRRTLLAAVLDRAVFLVDEFRDRIQPEAIANDLDLSFDRVEANMPAFVECYDEMFAWHHRVRSYLAMQLLALDRKFCAVCPGISSGFLRFISKVHPNTRIRRRLMNAISMLPEFGGLSRVPSAQIPWLSARRPAIIRDMIWWARNRTDMFLIRRLLKKHGDGRQRVLRSLDYVREYRRPEAREAICGWFSGEWIRSEPYLELFDARAKLESWPMIATDISAPANASLILDMVHSSQTGMP